MIRSPIFKLVLALVIGLGACDLFQDNDSIFRSSPGPILFLTRDITNDWKLFSMQPDGSDVRQLTSHFLGYGITNAVWSPDGSRILVVEYGPSPDTLGLTGLRLVDSQGKLMNTCSLDGYLRFAEDHDLIWSPDSEMFVHGFGKDGRTHRVINSTNCESRILGNDLRPLDRAVEWYPTVITDWSSDGQRLLGHTDYTFYPFGGGATKNVRVTQFSVDGDSLDSFGNFGDTYRWPVWSSDEQHIAVTIKNDEGKYLYRVSRDGDELVRLTDGYYNSPRAVAWSGDDTQILMSARTRGDSYPKIYIVAADGSGIVNINPIRGGMNIPTSWRSTR